MNRNKLRTLVATGAAAAVLGVTGFAFAAFVSNDAADATGAAERFVTVEADAAWLGADTEPGSGVTYSAKMLPGEAGAVELKFNNASNNVNARLVGLSLANITPGNITGIDPDWREYCAGRLQEIVTDATWIADHPTVVGAGDADARIIVPAAVTLVDGGDDDAHCQNMSFAMTWKAKFQASRDLPVGAA